MAALRILILAALCAISLASTDRLLGTSTPSCKDTFNRIIKENYASDEKCADMIKEAMETAPKSSTDFSDCPGDAVAAAGSDVQKCMSKNAATVDAWTSFIKTCEVLNVNERTGAGEAEAAGDAKPSCFPRFNNLDAFKSYLAGKTAATSAASATKLAQGSALLAAAAAGFVLLL